MTIEAWVYPTTTNNTWRTAIAKEQTGGLAYALFARSRQRATPRARLYRRRADRHGVHIPRRKYVDPPDGDL